MLFDLKKLGQLEEAYFITRLNRFTGVCRIGGKKYRCHIADSGRLKEILTSGRKLLVVKNRPGLKTDYKVIGAEMPEGWILLNTSLHSKIGKEAIKKGVLGFVPTDIKTEFTYRNSRIDYLIDGKILVELKGCNLLQKGECLFPDAPTVRGRKHLIELMNSIKDGFKPFILIMGLRECECFRTNNQLDPIFGKTFEEALKKGVRFAGFKVGIDTNFVITLKGKMELCL